MVGGIPSVLECVAKEMLQRGIRLNSVKEITVMSASLTEHAAKRITRAFNLTSFKNVYGSSEAAGPICVALRSATAYKTLGFPAPNTQLKVRSFKSSTWRHWLAGHIPSSWLKHSVYLVVTPAYQKAGFGRGIKMTLARLLKEGHGWASAVVTLDWHVNQLTRVP